ncbi:MAG: ABC transporter permease [Saprospiraceae bacterium]|nr:ABC transporter permease [Saprospiraceae bacterium]
MKVMPSIAWRYLFAHKGAHFINIISRITIFGISIGSAALILVLSVFNGFEELIANMINTFNPDLKVLPATGKYFEPDSATLDHILGLNGIAFVSQTIEETAYFEYEEHPSTGVMKGVDVHYQSVTGIDSALLEGKFHLEEDDRMFAILGSGMARLLSVDVLNVFNQLTVYMANRKQQPAGMQPFRQRSLYPVAIFGVQQDIDNEYVLVPLSFAQDLLSRPGAASALEIKVDAGVNITQVKESLKSFLGASFEVLDRYEQDEEFMKLMNIEKWMAFAIACLMILLIAFNLVGCLWMIVLDKKQDIAILKAMGGTSVFIKNIFIRLGAYFSLIGLGGGIVLAATLYLMQKQFGIISIPQGFVVDAYPIEMRMTDLLIVAFTVLTIGLLASMPAAIRASHLSASIRENG